MNVEYSKYQFRIKCVYTSNDKGVGKYSYYFYLSQSLIKSYESVHLYDNWYTQVTFDDGTVIIADKPIKRFKQEVLSNYNELLNEYMNFED